MYSKLDETSIRSGENLEIGVVNHSVGDDADMARDPALAAEIESLLEHKGPDWRAHISAALRGETDRLETRFYLGRLGGQPVANIMTVEQQGVGILGHVFTRPEHRRKGICQAVMTRQMEDFRTRGGSVLILGTGYESPAYWIYHSFGFRSLREGFMRYAAPGAERFEENWFRSAPTKVVPAEWRHWPLVALLASVPGDRTLRSAAWKLHGIGNLEGPYVQLMAAMASQRATAVVLESSSGAVVGCATALPDPLWPGTWIVDVFTHPNFSAEAAELLSSLPFPNGRLTAYHEIDPVSGGNVFETAGFHRECILSGLLAIGESRRNVALYVRNGAM
jgi:predicted N-acetyltransferase YhbS